MLKRVLLAGAWGLAPRAMFAIRHPLPAFFLHLGERLREGEATATQRRRRQARARIVAPALLAAGLALPLGLWAGRRLRAGREG